MKRTILVIISIVLILAAGFGFYAAYTGLEDVPGIQRNKNLQAADIEDAVDLIEENLDEYNEMIALQEEIDKAKAEEAEAAEGAEDGAAATNPATPAVTQAPARVSICKPLRTLAPSVAEAQDQYNRAQQNVDNCQAAYDAASQKVADSQAQLDAAQENLSANQAKANSISSSVNTANNAYNEYVAAQEKYNSIPSWLYSSKSAAKTEMSSKETAYYASLGSYSSIDEMNSALAAANKNVSSSKSDVSNAGQKLASDQQALHAAKSNLDSANSQLSTAKNNLSAAQSSQGSSAAANNTQTQHNNNNNNNNNTGIIGNLINKVDDQNKNKDKDKDKEKAEKDEKDAQETAEKLKKLKEYDDVKDLVEDGIDILLDNEEIASRVTDEKDLESIIEASRDYLEETNDSVKSELALRQQLYFALQIVSVVGAVVGLLGILVSIFPKPFLFVLSLLTSLITALSAIALNVYGYLGGYLNFKYARVNGNGDGQLQLYAMLAMMAAALLSVIVIALCRKSFKKALKKRQMREHLIQETEEAAKRRAAKNF